MDIIFFELRLSCRRVLRRKVQNGLLFFTFAVSLLLTLLSWSLYSTVHLSQPEFDPHGEYQLLTYENALIIDSNKSSQREMETYKAAQTVFDDFAELSPFAPTALKTPIGYERTVGAFMSTRALQITGAKPLLGTLFTSADDVFHAPKRILLSEKLWTNAYGRDPNVVGQLTNHDGDEAIIVGVLPASYRFPNDQDLWISYGSAYDSARFPLRTALVHLKPGITKARAISDLQTIQSSFPSDSLSKVRGLKVTLSPFREGYLLPEIRRSATLLLALSLLFMAVSCVNSANLMIIDFLGRRSEVATLLALGVPRGSAVRCVCWQIGLMALLAAGASIALLPLVGPLLFGLVKVLNAPFWLAYHFSWTDAWVGLGVAAISALATLIVPVAYLLVLDPEKEIRTHASTSRTSGRAIWRRALLGLQICLLTILGVCALLLVRSNRNVGEEKWGYAAAEVFNGKIGVDAINYPSAERAQGRLASLRLAFEGIRRRPDTLASAYGDNPPGYSNGPYCTYGADGKAVTDGHGAGTAFYSHVSDQFFATLGVPFVAGSDFPVDPSDTEVRDAILTESLARRLFPDGAIGHRLFMRTPWMRPGEPPIQVSVRGIVRDFQADGPRGKTNDAIYVPFLKRDGNGTTLHIFVRDRNGLPSARSLADAVHSTEMRATLYLPSTLKRQIDFMLSSLRMTTDLTSIFALAAVILCSIGVYSLTVAQVLQSAREFGIRMAIGAESRRLWWDFTRGHLSTVAIGVALGLLGTSQLVPIMTSLLYGVDTSDGVTYLMVAATILVVAGLACIPSFFRLNRINPADCLRSL